MSKLVKRISLLLIILFLVVGIMGSTQLAIIHNHYNTETNVLLKQNGDNAIKIEEQSIDDKETSQSIPDTNLRRDDNEGHRFMSVDDEVHSHVELNDTKVQNQEVNYLQHSKLDLSTNNSTTFLSQWNTGLVSPGSSQSDQIKLPLESSGTYNFEVDWGDNTTDVITTYNQPEVTHTYASEGEYNLTISGILKGWKFDNTGDKMKIIEISQWGNISLGNSGSYFYGTENLVLTAEDAPDLTDTWTLDRTFQNCYALGSNGNMSEWDVSAVISMRDMFNDASSFNQPIGNWDVSAVNFMTAMFRGASSFNQPIGNWNVSDVNYMSVMFYDASSFNQPIGNWDVSAVTSMYSMFRVASSFNQPIGNWNVSAVDDMRNMFVGVTLSIKNYDDLLSGWSTLSLKHFVNFNAGNSQHSIEAADAREYIINTYDWTIEDGGLYIDPIPPNLDSPDDISYEPKSTGNTIVWTVGDIFPSVYNITLDGDLYVDDTTWMNGSITVNVDGLSVGQHNLRIAVYDLYNNSATDTVIVTIKDNPFFNISFKFNLIVMLTIFAIIPFRRKLLKSG